MTLIGNYKLDFYRQGLPTTDNLQKWFKEDTLDVPLLCHFYKEWRKQQYSVVFSDENGDTITVPCVKRGTEAYYRRNYAKFCRYRDEFRQFGKLRFTKTRTYEEYDGSKRRVYKTDEIFITATYDPDTYGCLHDFWKECGRDFNRWFTSIKSRLKTRQISILYYIRAWEAQRNGRPHIHIIAKLSKPLKFYKQFVPDKNKAMLILLPNTCTSLAGNTFIIDKYFFNWREGATRTYGIETPSKGNDPIAYISKYITKVYNPIHETFKSLQTQAIQWILRKRSFSHTRLKRDVKQVTESDHLNNVKIYQVIGFTKEFIFPLPLPDGRIVNYSYLQFYPAGAGYLSRYEYYSLYLSSTLSRRITLFELYNWQPTDGYLTQIRLVPHEHYKDACRAFSEIKTISNSP